jgi:hypothetical protein
MRIEAIDKNPILVCVACAKELASNRLVFDQIRNVAAPLCDGCLADLSRLFIKFVKPKQLDAEPTIFKFHYYPTRGYACSQAGDNTGYYVSLNEYERLRNKGTDNEP